MDDLDAALAAHGSFLWRAYFNRKPHFNLNSSLTGVTCKGCNKEIDVASQGGLEAFGSKWHPFCFTCSKCGRGLNGETYVKFEGKPMCEHCYDSMVVCEGCDELIEGGSFKIAILLWVTL